MHGPRNFAKSDVLPAQLVWAAENETLKNYGVNASGTSSSVAEVWRGVAGIGSVHEEPCFSGKIRSLGVDHKNYTFLHHFRGVLMNPCYRVNFTRVPYQFLKGERVKS